MKSFGVTVVVSVLQQEGCGCEVCVVCMFSMATSKDMHGGEVS